MDYGSTETGIEPRFAHDRRPTRRVIPAARMAGRRGNNAGRWARLSCKAIVANAVRLQIQVLAYNRANIMRTFALPERVESWSLTIIRMIRKDLAGS